MNLLLDAAYAIAAAATAPWWMRKARGGWAERFGRTPPLPAPTRPRLLIHAVSLGEVNLTPPLVRALTPHVEVVLAATTDTGIARARDLYKGVCDVVRYPLDASWAVRRFLNAVKPDGAALVELELWPNFLDACRKRGIPVAVVNGRLSARSFGRYRLARPLLGRYFRQLHAVAAQDQDYAARFIEMGVAPSNCTVAGTMKWDSALVADSVPGADQLAAEMRIDPSRPLIVAGSTAPDEHELLHRATPPGVQLLCAPRRPEWCDDAAQALPGCVRRTAPGVGDPTSLRFLLDTTGELRKAYSLAGVIVIGRSFGALHGSDPMEAAALGKPVVIGPRFGDFESAVRALEADRAIVRTTRDELPGVLKSLIENEAERQAMGERARRCVLKNQGAAARHAELLLTMMRSPRAAH